MDAISFSKHYVEYITSPQILLTVLILFVPFLFSKFAQDTLAPKSSSIGVPGCRRLGMYKRSNLDDQYDQSPSSTDKARVKALFAYPVKSCRGVELAASEVEAKGLKYDRMFTFAQWVPRRDDSASDEDQKHKDGTHEWRFMTLRENPRLALLQTQLWLPDRRPGKSSIKPSRNPEGSFAENGGCLVVQFSFSPQFNPFGMRKETVTIQVPLEPTSKRSEAKRYSKENIVIWKDCPQGTNVTNEIKPDSLEKLRLFLGVKSPLALFRVDDAHLRSVLRSLPKDKPDEDFKVGFVDAFSVNLLGISSVRAIDESIPAASNLKGSLDARRFRANIYITGVPAYTEDTWKKIVLGRRIGRDRRGLFETEGEYHIACRTARCTLPNVDPNTGVRDRNEPWTTLAKTRKVDKGAYPHPCLGMQMIPLFERGMVRAGDEIDVLETGEHVYEKMFPDPPS